LVCHYDKIEPTAYVMPGKTCIDRINILGDYVPIFYENYYYIH
jgi:hypothetical protein